MKRFEEASSKLRELQEELSDIRYDEQDYLDNIPENLQSSERYINAEYAVDNLENAESSLEEIIDALDVSEFNGYIEEAVV